MKRIIAAVAILLIATLSLCAQEKKQIVKTGRNFGPLPLVAYDADKGLELGAQLNIYNFGDGSNYPNYNSKFFIEGAYYTKGTMMFNMYYDNKVLIPGVRWSSAISFQKEKAMDFYGFNGYESYFNYEALKAGKKGESFNFSPYYKMQRTFFLAKTDFIGEITKNFYWQAGYQLTYTKISPINRENINKGKDDSKKFPDYMPTLYDEYVAAGYIGQNEKDGGLSSILRFGLKYDSRDKEGAPTRGIWAEGHVSLAPKWLGSKNDFYRYTLTWRHYLPVVKNDILTFAYRLNYEGNFGDSAPFYALPFITIMGENFDKDGMGGYRTVRGLVRDRVVGLDMATYNAELRWRFVNNLKIGKQNVAFGLNIFSDGVMATRKIKTWQVAGNFPWVNTKETMHVTVGAGFRFIMNENFIVAAEYGMPISNFYSKTSPLYKQDGGGAFYLNTGYLF